MTKLCPFKIVCTGNVSALNFYCGHNFCWHWFIVLQLVTILWKSRILFQNMLKVWITWLVIYGQQTTQC
jgi:hypothetical protein